jgi:integrase/recombinase XerD
MTMMPQDAKEMYLQSMRERNLSARTLQQTSRHVERFIDFARVRTLGEITHDIIFAYQVKLWSEGLRVSTQRGILITVGLFLRYHHEQGNLFYDLSLKIKLPKLRDALPDKIVSRAEMTQILAMPDTKSAKGIRDRAMLELLYSSGLRRQELVNLNLYDFNENERTLTIRQGKGQKDRIVPIGKVAVKWLKTYLSDVRRYYVASDKEQALIISLRTGKRLFWNAVCLVIREYRLRSKKSFSAHSFRHACATHMLQNGADVRYVQEMLGHASARTTQIYTHLDIKDLKHAAKRSHPREQKQDAVTTPDAVLMYHYKKKRILS